MAFTFNRTLTGYFEWKLMELLYRYSENQHVLRGIHYLDLTLVDPENSVVIYTKLTGYCHLQTRFFAFRYMQICRKAEYHRT